MKHVDGATAELVELLNPPIINEDGSMNLPSHSDPPPSAEKARELVSRGADVNSTDDGGEPLLSGVLKSFHSAMCFLNEEDAALAAERFRQYRELVQVLLESGADPNCPSESGDLPLEVVVKAELGSHVLWGNNEQLKDLLELLVRHGARVNERGRHRTPLFCAVEQTHASAVRLLLGLGADKNLEIEGWSPLSRAVELEGGWWEGKTDKLQERYQEVLQVLTEVEDLPEMDRQEAEEATSRPQSRDRPWWKFW